MSWFTEVVDAVSQWLVGAPIAVQMLVLTLTAVPALVVAAWILMWFIDAAARRFRPARVPKARMVTHVDP